MKRIKRKLKKKGCRDIEKGKWKRVSGKHHPRFNDLTGRKFDKLQVISFINTKNGVSYWKCECSCGNIQSIKRNRLLTNKKIACNNCVIPRGILKGDKNPKFKDLTGKRYGKLIVLNKIGIKNKQIIWKCLCDCGNKTEAKSADLNFGNKKSCGCLSIRLLKGEKSYSWNPNLTEEERLRNRTKSPKYNEWRKNVFSRDSYKCQITNSRGWICAHHLTSWDSDENLRYDPTNGITLLKSVHILFHKIYGYGNNNKFQFKEFKRNLTEKQINKLIKDNRELENERL